MLAPLAALVALLPALASATLKITSPTGAGWVGNTTVPVTWTFDATDPTFSIELGNPDVKTGLLESGPIAIANNVQPNVGSLQILLPVIPPASGYWVKFVKVDDINTVYATSPTFAISNNPTSSSVSSSSTSSTSGSKTSTLVTTTTAGNSTKTTKSKGTNTGTSTGTLNGTTLLTTSSSSQSITTLQISTVSSSSPTSTSSKGAASSKMDVSMGWNVASLVALGSIILGSLVVA